MNKKWKYRKELLTAIILTGTMLLVPMSTYAAWGPSVVLGSAVNIIDGGTIIGEQGTAAEAGVVIGTLATDTGRCTTLVGYQTSATRAGNLALGAFASTGTNYEEAGYVNIVIGIRSNSSTQDSISIGADSTTKMGGVNVGDNSSTEEYAVAFGADSHATAENSIALGKGTTVEKKDSIALGKGTVGVTNSVVLGFGSTVKEDDLLSGYNSKFDWDVNISSNETNGIVSIGSLGEERRLIHVANGRIAENSTDAVNGGQLYKVWNDLYNQLSLSNEYPGDAGGTSSGTSSGGTDPDGGDYAGKSDFQLVNGGNLIKGTTVAGKKTGYAVDGNGNIDLQVKDKPGNDGTTRHVIITDVASATALENVSDQVNKNTTQIDQNTQNIANIPMIMEQNTQDIEQLKQSLSQLDDRIDRVGAGAAALAALHPLDFDPEAKWDFAAGYGNYKSANAIAVGTYYRPNEDTMLSVGGSFGGGENMVNMSVSIKLGSGSNAGATSRLAMAKKIKTMTKRNEVMAKAIEDTQKEMDSMKATMRNDKA